MRFITKLSTVLSIAFLTIAVLLVGFNVIARYVFNYGVVWCEEAIRYSVIFATFWGLSLAISKNECMKIDVILQITRGKVRLVLSIIGLLIETVTLICLFYFSILLVAEAMETGQITPSTDYPMYLPFAVVAFGVGVCMVTSFYTLYKAICGGK